MAEEVHSSSSPPRPAASRHTAVTVTPQTHLKSKMAKGFRSLLSWGTGSESKPTVTTLFPKVNPTIDGDDCDHDCTTCTIIYPKGFKIEKDMELYGGLKAWETHLVVATGKSDWVRDISDEKGSVMETMGSVKGMKLSASNIPLPDHATGYGHPTSALLLPAMTIIENVLPSNVPALLRDHIQPSIKTTTRLGGSHNDAAAEEVEGEVSGLGCRGKSLTETMGEMKTSVGEREVVQEEARVEVPPEANPLTTPERLTLKTRPCPHNALILLCSQRTRDARCGQSAPLVRRELERHLRPLGLYRDIDDERPGGVGIYFISHTGGHKWSANVLIYRRPNPWGVDGKGWAAGGVDEAVRKAVMEATKKNYDEDEEGGRKSGAAECIWLARVKPSDCEGIVKYTVLQGKVVNPEWQLRGGFDRRRGLVSW